AVRRAAARVVPASSSADVEEVTRRLDRPLASLLANATAVEPGADWSIAWPPDAPAGYTIVGRSDLLVRDGQGAWSVVTFSPPGSPEAVERLRWFLSARAEILRGRSPVGPGWRIALTDPPRLHGDDLPDPRALNDAVAAALQDPGPW
ncbi:MAG: hypothetical protein K2X91_15975, partial [Thermoleophilia bacterium]|nr:hypothetical protein [Thermoleophilia bacterium]